MLYFSDLYLALLWVACPDSVSPYSDTPSPFFNKPTHSTPPCDHINIVIAC